jgi:hypothetical protein
MASLQAASKRDAGVADTVAACIAVLRFAVARKYDCLFFVGQSPHELYLAAVGARPGLRVHAAPGSALQAYTGEGDEDAAWMAAIVAHDPRFPRTSRGFKRPLIIDYSLTCGSPNAFARFLKSVFRLPATAKLDFMNLYRDPQYRASVSALSKYGGKVHIRPVAFLEWTVPAAISSNTSSKIRTVPSAAPPHFATMLRFGGLVDCPVYANMRAAVRTHFGAGPGPGSGEERTTTAPCCTRGFRAKVPVFSRRLTRDEISSFLRDEVAESHAKVVPFGRSGKIQQRKTVGYR